MTTTASPNYIKKRIITDNLYGVDLMEEATDIAKLRLFLALVASADSVAQLEPLPNIDFNILPGNSLIGLTRVDPNEFDKQGSDAKGQVTVQTAIFGSPYQKTVADVNRLITVYKQSDRYAETLTTAREEIRTLKRKANETLDDLLLDKFKAQKIQFEAATWDDAKNKAGRPQKRVLNANDIRALKPFHWGFEFHKVLQERGGFDAIITNPPWDVFQTDEKEFFRDYVPNIQKNKLRIEDWKEQQAELMKRPDLREAWLKYASGFPHVAKYLKTSTQYANQISYVDGRNIGSKLNLYKLFIEQCFNLLRPNGQCGIVVPDGIYTEVGCKGLRELLFNSTRITGLFGFENRKEIFEGVHRSFKFVVLTFEKSGTTEAFPTAFMHLDVKDLEGFPDDNGLSLSVDFIHRMSPKTSSILEIKNGFEQNLAEKVFQSPGLGEQIDGSSNTKIGQEFNMTSDNGLFKTQPAENRLRLFEGKMIHHFTHTFAEPRYWVEEEAGRQKIVGRRATDDGQMLNYQGYRFGFRDVARNTDERTLISTVLPANVFCGNTVNLSQALDDKTALFTVGVMNSFTLDWAIRQKVTDHVNIVYAKELPVPRLTSQSPAFSPIVERAAKLICTTPEFDDLAAEVGLGSSQNGVTDPEERAALRAELDGLVAHLYGLTEEEFAYILTTFPLVDESVKTAALAAFRQTAPDPDDATIEQLIAVGEGKRLEFKEAAVINPHTGRRDDSLKQTLLKAVAAFLNSSEGGAVLVGVADDGSVTGLEADIPAANPQKGNWDGFERWLRGVLSDGLGAANTSFYSLTRHVINGKTVCRIAVSPAAEPVYLSGELHVRDGGGKRKLTAQAAATYTRQRWGRP